MKKIDIEKNQKLYIGGKWVNGKEGETFSTFCPANGELLSNCASAGKEDVDLAVKAAWRAFETWKDISIAERSRILLKIADQIENNAERLAIVETMDNGMPIRLTEEMIPRRQAYIRTDSGRSQRERKCVDEEKMPQPSFSFETSSLSSWFIAGGKNHS